MRGCNDPLSEEMIEQDTSEMVEFLMVNAKPFSLEKRTINVTNQKVAKEVDKKVSNDKSGFMELAKLILLVRREMKHKGVRMIDMNSPEYSALKRLTQIVNQFADDFNLNFKGAATIYLRLGLSKITSFRNYIGKLCDMGESISLEYEAKTMIDNDKFKSETLRIHNIYVGTINVLTGMSDGYIGNYSKYIAFMRVRELCEKYKILPETYITAQFEGLAWTDNFPEPAQLVTEKAIERLNKYLYSKKIKFDNANKTKTDNSLSSILNKIKNGEREN
jgi:hypothetical protein